MSVPSQEGYPKVTARALCDGLHATSPIPANVAFRTRDGVIGTDACPDVDASVNFIKRSVDRPITYYCPQKSPGDWFPLAVPNRLYERTSETYCGLPLFQEVET